MKIGFIKRFLNYKLIAKSKKGHGIHSPFVFDLLNNVINREVDKHDFEFIESLRKRLLKSEKRIEVHDFGAGSVCTKSAKRQVRMIAKYSLKSPKYASLLFRLVKHFEPEEIIELGTSFGITTLYLAKASLKANLYTIEGCPEISEISRENFLLFNSGNISLINGIFDDELPKLLIKTKKADFVFFDGNHRKIPTLKYFELCLKHKSSDSLFVFDDIHLSDEMEQAWNEIKANKEVSITIDIFYLGLVFFRKGIEKQNFVIDY